MSKQLSRSARIVLLLSLALNIALGTMLWMHGPWRDGRDRGSHRAPPGLHLFDVRALKRSLPAERQKVLDDAIAVHREPMRAALGRLFEARIAVRDAIRAPAYDRAALDAAFAQLRSAEATTAGEAQAMLGDVLDAATPEERVTLSEMMAKRSPRARADRREHRQGDGPRVDPD
jgi:hypothetical protein